MKHVRVYMYVDLSVEDESEIAETLQRVLTEGEPYVGDDGIEITGHDVLGVDDEEVEEDTSPRPTLRVHAHVTDDQLIDFCNWHEIGLEWSDDPRIARMRMILAIRASSPRIRQLFLDKYPVLTNTEGV